MLTGQHQGGGAVLRLQHPETVPLQVQPQQGADVRVVLSDENQWIQTDLLLLIYSMREFYQIPKKGETPTFRKTQTFVKFKVAQRENTVFSAMLKTNARQAE